MAEGVPTTTRARPLTAAAASDFVASDEVALKLLVPNYATGAIIGKSGATITQIQAVTATRMRLSQVPGMFTPGTRPDRRAGCGVLPGHAGARDAHCWHAGERGRCRQEPH